MPIVIRPPASEAERLRYYTLADQAFGDTPSEETARGWMQFVAAMPEQDSTIIQLALEDETVLGGYTAYYRRMLVEGMPVPTACIGAVVTDPDIRQKGVARAFLTQLDTYARQRGDAIILLDGIPHFYHRFGYVKVFDTNQYVISAAALTDLPATDCTAREATAEDLPALRDLYEQTRNRYTGAFVRSLAVQEHRWSNPWRSKGRIVFVDSDQRIIGYIQVGSEKEISTAYEVMLPTQEGIIAALHFHHTHAPDQDLAWRMPAGDATALWLQDHLVIPGYDDENQNVLTISAVTQQTFHQHNTSWMAKICDSERLTESLFPLWQQRWRHGLHDWHGSFSIVCPDLAPVTLGINGGTLLRDAPAPVQEVRLTNQQLTQLVFGYRSVAQMHLGYPAEIEAVLTALFPAGQTFITNSDNF